MKKMKKSVFIVNINSDQLFVETDLLTCLKNGQIGAAAFDSYSFSPSTSFTTTLASMPNVICTPKMSWYSDSSNKELRESAARQVRQILLDNIKPSEFQNCVNRDALVSATSNLLIQPSTSSAFLGHVQNTVLEQILSTRQIDLEDLVK
jgi:phosphoglycerate dehydrogenase-like enzyme